MLVQLESGYVNGFKDEQKMPRESANIAVHSAWRKAVWRRIINTATLLRGTPLKRNWTMAS